MDALLKTFIVVALAVLVYQTVILALLYRQLSETTRKMTHIATDLHEKSDPILTRIRMMLDDLHPRVSAVAADAQEISMVARSQAHKVDRMMSEALDLLRLQIIRADQLMTGAMTSLEEAGTEVRKTVMGPVQQAAAIIQGVKAGIEVIRGARRSSPERARERQDEELFI
jgi:type IV secretory pathway VirB2 component (pilin)